jgi:glycosyltransferase involved in cell wall biosynthesis
MMNERKIYVAIPCMNEIDFIEKTISCIRSQSYANFKLFVCVNQPEKYHFI